jgi:HSP20 family protein
METKTPSKTNGEAAVEVTPTNGEKSVTPRDEFSWFRSTTPFTAMRRFADDMERMFEDWGVTRGRFSELFGSRPEFAELEKLAFAPQIETVQKEDHFIVRADLPGVKKEDVHLEIKENAIELRGERKQQKEEKRDGYVRTERSYGSFFRRIPLPEGANIDKTKASFNDGVLEISVKTPKGETNGRKIEIE